MQPDNQITTHIQSHDLADLLKQVIDACKQGYELDLESSQNYPRNLGTSYILCMVKPVNDTIVDVQAEVVKSIEVESLVVEDSADVSQDEDKVVKKRGRTAKGV